MGRGTVYSYAVHHRPELPGLTLPLIIALIELEEAEGGIRIVSNLQEVRPEDVQIGMAVELFFQSTKDGLLLPQFRPLHPWTDRAVAERQS